MSNEGSESNRFHYNKHGSLGNIRIKYENYLQ